MSLWYSGLKFCYLSPENAFCHFLYNKGSIFMFIRLNFLCVFHLCLLFSRNFTRVAVLQSQNSRSNITYLPKCSFRMIHMESSKQSDSRGALIVLEGLDRCGKTSQCSRLLSYLEELGHAVESWRFPDRNTGVGQMISSYLTNDSQLNDQAIHLLFSANRWEKRLTCFELLIFK